MTYFDATELADLERAYEARRAAYGDSDDLAEKLWASIELVKQRPVKRADPPKPPPDPTLPKIIPIVGGLKDCSKAERAICDAIAGRKKGNGITAHELGALAGITPRAARAIVAHCIAVHELAICSTPSESYFTPLRIEDATETIRSLCSRRKEIEARVNGLRGGLQRRFGSLPLFTQGDA